MSPAEYDETILKVNQAGAGAPKGRTCHVEFLEGDKVAVFDVWDSKEDFDAFGRTLTPILEGVGVEVPELQVAEVHNVIRS
jgi:hypothetical protein